MRIKGTREEAMSGDEFWVVKESSGRYAIHNNLTYEEIATFITMDGPYSYSEAIEMMQGAVSGEWD